MCCPDGVQIEATLDKCCESEAQGASRYPGMTYEQGVRAGIEWVLGRISENPLEDE